MPNFLIGVLAQRINIVPTVVNACPIDTTTMDIIYPNLGVNACPIDTSTMDIIYNV